MQPNLEERNVTEHLLLPSDPSSRAYAFDSSSLIYLFLAAAHLLNTQYFNFLSVLMSLAPWSVKLLNSSVTVDKVNFFSHFCFLFNDYCFASTHAQPVKCARATTAILLGH